MFVLCIDASVRLTGDVTGIEGDTVSVCVELYALPSGGSEVDVVVGLEAKDGTKAGNLFKNSVRIQVVSTTIT